MILKGLKEAFDDQFYLEVFFNEDESLRNHFDSEVVTLNLHLKSKTNDPINLGSLIRSECFKEGMSLFIAEPGFHLQLRPKEQTVQVGILRNLTSAKLAEKTKIKIFSAEEVKIKNDLKKYADQHLGNLPIEFIDKGSGIDSSPNLVIVDFDEDVFEAVIELEDFDGVIVIMSENVLSLPKKVVTLFKTAPLVVEKPLDRSAFGRLFDSIYDSR